ncbi:MAG: hypothetical protein NT062_34145 [Proteobacteria bacterium]|nr:hypothetical protein [Pseudomonadota bacterium]
MPSRPDLRELATNVKDAFTDMDRDTLLDILTFVIKEYVVEGPPPMLLHQAETLADLKPASFAQLVTALQARFDFPELAMLVVDGEAVSARVGGVVQPLLAQRTPPPGVQMIDTRPAPAPAPVAPVAPPPAPRVQVVETNLSPRPAPPPSRGLSIRGRPADGEMPTPSAAASPPPAAPPAAAAPTPPQNDKPEPSGGGDDASARFSLLELD